MTSEAHLAELERRHRALEAEIAEARAQMLWVAVILLSPLQQLTRRPRFVVAGVLALIAFSGFSKLNLHQYLQPVPRRTQDKRQTN